MKRISPWHLLLTLPGLCTVPMAASADTHVVTAGDTIVSSARADNVVYPAAFFRRYQPTTALDMVQAVPGFQLDEGDDKRGFGGAAGNILINDRRPSAKQDTISAILGRIPASSVERIEIVRGQVGGLDLGGYSVVANVFVSEASRASLRWEAYVERNLEPKPWNPGGNVSLSNRWSDIDYNLGFGARRIVWGDDGTDKLFDDQDVLTEIRTDDSLTKGREYSVNLSTSTYLGEVLFQSNIKAADQRSKQEIRSLRVPQNPDAGAREEIFNNDDDMRQFELGIDAERKLGSDLAGKAILLYSRQNTDEISSQRSIDTAGDQTQFRSAETDKTASEIIARLELDWAGFANHAIQFNLETAFNTLDGALVQTEDTGSGLILVPVPGANTRVEEERVDILLKDNWSLGRFELAYGIGAEASTITQTGDAELERSFTFIKPEALLTYSPARGRQTRVRLGKEVSQLNFDDFISATVFEDDDLALGNPDLQPETTWIAELSHERRFGDFSVATVTVFYHWISDVEDLLPLSPTFEAPGNIGDGRRWGLEFESTLPMDWSGFTGARLDVKARWQDSRVTDPVTGQTRVLSSKQESGPAGEYAYLRNETRYAAQVDFRQDLEASRVAWGWTMKSRSERPFFKVNELEILDEDVELNAFLETTRWWDLKIRFDVNRILELDKTRDRTLYPGERDLTAPDSYIRRSRQNDRELMLTFSGIF